MEWERTERGSRPNYVETVIILWQFCLISRDIKVVYKQGLAEYMTDLWNIADWFTNLCFISWIILRFTSCYMVSLEIAAGQDPYLPREEWYAYDPYLISEGLFGAGMISSYLKIVQILSVNPHLGSLQISLGRMIMDILKWVLLGRLSDKYDSLRTSSNCRCLSALRKTLHFSDNFHLQHSWCFLPSHVASTSYCGTMRS